MHKVIIDTHAKYKLQELSYNASGLEGGKVMISPCSVTASAWTDPKSQHQFL
jgi:hypothetical protein